MRDIDMGLGVARAQACGRCGSTLVRRVQYGMPTSPEPEPGTRLGGCMVMPGLPLIQCLSCGQSGAISSVHWRRTQSAVAATTTGSR